MSDVFIILLLVIIVLLAIVIGLMLGQGRSRGTLRDIQDVITVVLFIAFIILLPIGIGAGLFLWFGPIGFWQTLAAFILVCIVIAVLYGLELVIIAIFA